MKDIQDRQEALKRYLQGLKVSTIALSLGRSRKWVYHWIKRYTDYGGQGDWFLEESRAPKQPQRSFSDSLTELILSIRRELEQERMAQTGAISIQYELARRGVKSVPEVWTINRILAKHGYSKRVDRSKEPQEYPEPFIHTHQMDLVGPRYIKGNGHYYSVNLIDTLTHSCYVKAVRTKSSNGIVQAIAEFWAVHGMPDALQMDNELAFRGSNRYPRSFGSVVRFALSQNVVPVFIPVGEPWRNGMIEKFNSTYQRRFIRAYNFEDFPQLCRMEKEFIEFHNARHRYSTQGQRTPNEMLQEYPMHYKYNESLHLPSLRGGNVQIPLQSGSILYIRYIRSDCKLYLPNESFELHEDLKYSYVVAEISVDTHTLFIRRNHQIVQAFPYTITAVDW